MVVASAAPNQPPTITLIGPATITFEQDSIDSYLKCASSAALDAICERGITASDPEDGDIALKVLACGNKYAKVGLLGCNVNVTVPGTYDVTYSVTDSRGSPAPSVVRTVVITPACPDGEFKCDDGSCSQGESRYKRRQTLEYQWLAKC